MIGDFEGNYRFGLPSELALITLYRSDTGAPFAIVDGTLITWMRTGAVTAVGAKYLAPERPRVLGHVGARGTAWYNVPMLDRLFDFEEIRVTSKRPESRERFAARMSEQLGKRVRVEETVEATVRDADIIIDASRLVTAEVLVKDRWVKPGALIQPYGVEQSVESSLPVSVDKMVVDDWNQCQKSEYGQFADDDPGRRAAGRAHLRRDRRDRRRREAGPRVAARADPVLAQGLRDQRHRAGPPGLREGAGEGDRDRAELLPPPTRHVMANAGPPPRRRGH